MKSESLKRGDLVVSLAGHDRGEAFVITEMVDDNYALVVNGESRKLEAPKKKKLKHVKVLNAQIDLESLIKRGDCNNATVARLIKENLK